MQVREITVSAGRTFNHPFESYSNLKPMVTVKADLADGEDFEEAIKALQAKAESLVEDHKRHMLKSIEELHELECRRREAASLERKILDCQRELDRIRNNGGQLALEIGGSDDGDDSPDDMGF